MGNYTELVLNIELIENCNPAVIAVLELLANEGPLPTVLPDHEFFKCDRWQQVLSGSSHAFIPFENTRFENNEDIGQYFLSTRFDLKNYDREIQKFVDWLWPSIDSMPGDFLGYFRHDNDDAPTLIFNPPIEEEVRFYNSLFQNDNKAEQ